MPLNDMLPLLKLWRTFFSRWHEDGVSCESVVDRLNSLITKATTAGVSIAPVEGEEEKRENESTKPKRARNLAERNR